MTGSLDALARFLDIDPDLVAVASERAADAARQAGSVPAPPRSAEELRCLADTFRQARERREAGKAAAEKSRLAAAEARARHARLTALAERGESVWRDVEVAIARRNATGYGQAISLLLDLKALATEEGTSAGFARRMRAIRERHASKPRFIARLDAMG